jgi:hypothetical protein
VFSRSAGLVPRARYAREAGYEFGAAIYRHTLFGMIIQYDIQK